MLVIEQKVDSVNVGGRLTLKALVRSAMVVVSEIRV